MLTNAIRRHFGIKEIDSSWRKLEVKDLWQGYLLVDKDNVVQKLIYPAPKDSFSYREVDYILQLNKDFKIEGKRGKIHPLTAATFLKIKPDGKSFYVDERSLKLLNHSNDIPLFNEYDLDWNSENDAIEFLNRKISSQDEFFSKEIDKYLNTQRRVNQEFRQGDIFRVKLAKERFAYGRIVADLKKFLTHDTGIVSEWKVDLRGRCIFNSMMSSDVLIDYFMVITKEPYLTYNDLKNYKITSTVIITEGLIKYGAYTVVDHTAIDPSSFDLPMGLDTYFDYDPVCHIFKWGGCVVTFKPDKKVEKLMGIGIKDDRTYYRGPYGRSAEHYIKSCIDGTPDHAFFARDDLRNPDYKKLKEIISDYLDFDLSSNDYDGFAAKYGFMDRNKLLSFTV
jgi:hypothetical protein